MAISPGPSSSGPLKLSAIAVAVAVSVAGIASLFRASQRTSFPAPARSVASAAHQEDDYSDESIAELEGKRPRAPATESLPFKKRAVQPRLDAIKRMVSDPVVRGEEVDVLFERLAPVKGQDYLLTLNPFDLKIEAEMNPPSLLGVREMLLSGVVAGEPGSRVDLVVHEGKVGGRIKSLRGTFKIISVPDHERERVFIVEIDQRR